MVKQKSVVSYLIEITIIIDDDTEHIKRANQYMCQSIDDVVDAVTESIIDVLGKGKCSIQIRIGKTNKKVNIKNINWIKKSP